MKSYHEGSFGVLYVLTANGSVLPKALLWAIPAAGLCFLYNQLYKSTYDCHPEDLEGMTNVAAEKPECHTDASLVQAALGGYFGIMCFALVFRSHLAYTRYWEGATLIEQVRGEWFNATSSLFAFCTPDPSKQAQVSKFQHLFVRLMSMLFCAALHEVTSNYSLSSTYSIIENDGMDPELLEYVKHSANPVEILLQWAERSIMDHSRNAVLEVPPPILSRAFQELGAGMVTLTNARKVTDIPFPFPYAQVQTIMLLIFWVGFPYASATVMLSSPYLASFATFLTMLVLFCTHYMALEIESPFGFKINNLPLKELMADYNNSLITLLDKRSQIPPGYEFNASNVNPIVAVKEDYDAFDASNLVGKGHHKAKRRQAQQIAVRRKSVEEFQKKMTPFASGSSFQKKMSSFTSGSSICGSSMSLGGIRSSSKDTEAAQREVALAAKSMTHCQCPPELVTESRWSTNTSVWSRQAQDEESAQREVAAIERSSTHCQCPPELVVETVSKQPAQPQQEWMRVPQLPKATLLCENGGGEVAPASRTMSIPYSTFTLANKPKVQEYYIGDESGPWIPLPVTQFEQSSDSDSFNQASLEGSEMQPASSITVV
jgi:predicted membrane chloride channel (bestrophin family)